MAAPDFGSTSTPVKVVGFIAALAVVFGLTLAAGRFFGPVDTTPQGEHADTAEGGHGGEDGGHAASPTPTQTSTDDGGDMQGETPSAATLPGGLQVSQDGYTFSLHHDRATPNPRATVEFVIEGPDGKPVTDFTVQHEKELHLIAVRRDFTGFQHVHPTRADDGTWSTELALTPGAWRLFADIAPKGADPMTLGKDLLVSGEDTPAEAAAGDVRTAKVDNYTVTLEGDVAAGTDSELTLSVSRGGEPVTDLDPYLGAYGHLVALRAGDLAYLHVHPEGHPGDGTTKAGPDITFGTSVPSVGTYRLFLDFKHEGVVRTAEFTLTAGGAGAASSPTGGSSEHQH